MMYELPSAELNTCYNRLKAHLMRVAHKQEAMELTKCDWLCENPPCSRENFDLFLEL